MINKPTLHALNAAGEALKALGEDRITLTYAGYDGDLTFTVGLKSAAAKYAADTFGHGPTALDAYQAACAERARAATQSALRARIEREVEERIRSEMMQEAA